LEVLDERGRRVPVARQVSEGQARQLLRAIEQEANRRRYAIAEIVDDPVFMAQTVLAIKRGNGR
jgi:peptide subunit release factor 1 (eRF1)